MFNEFKSFILRGNVIDLAVGLIMGVAFTGVVNSLVNDIVMPPIGAILGGVDFSNLFIDLSGKSPASVAAAKEAGLATINFGVFINGIINFLVVAFAVFLLVKAVNQLMVKPQPTAELPKPDPALEMQKRLADSMDRLTRALESRNA